VAGVLVSAAKGFPYLNTVESVFVSARSAEIKESYFGVVDAFLAITVHQAADNSADRVYEAALMQRFG